MNVAEMAPPLKALIPKAVAPDPSEPQDRRSTLRDACAVNVVTCAVDDTALDMPMIDAEEQTALHCRTKLHCEATVLMLVTVTGLLWEAAMPPIVAPYPCEWVIVATVSTA
jgi:hypothetical protein